MSGQVFASVPALLVAFAGSVGLPRARALEVAGLTEEALADSDALVPYESLVAVWRELIALHPREPLGARYASLWSFDALGVVGYLVRHAANGHRALALTLRFSRLADPFLRVATVREGDRHTFTIDHEPRVVAMVEPMEMLVLATVRMAISLVRDDVRPLEVCFRHAARHPRSVYADLLGAEVPVRFGAPFDGVSFASSLLDLPLRAADPRMATYLERHAEELLQHVNDEAAPLEVRVRQAIETALPSGAASAREVARGLGLSVRSLQRALAERGLTFSGEVDAAREVRALSLLRRPQLTVAEVAFMLGYADSRVFHRSFRRWTGLTPTEYRRAK
jgi:AraC-like DNA-binding protein